LLPFRQKNTTKQNIHQWSTSGPGQENSAASPLATVPAAYPPENK
jgi:hypothetical protein